MHILIEVMKLRSKFNIFASKGGKSWPFCSYEPAVNIIHIPQLLGGVNISGNLFDKFLLELIYSLVVDIAIAIRATMHPSQVQFSPSHSPSWLSVMAKFLIFLQISSIS